MKLGDGVEQAIHSVVMLSGLAPDGVLSAAAVAEFHGVSASYLLKHLQALSGAGIVQTLPGPKGGYRLARPPEEITLLDTVRLTEESFSMAECFEDGDVTCPLADSCDVNSALREALGAFFNVLESYTIADLASKRKSLRDRLGLKFEDMEPVLIREAAH